VCVCLGITGKVPVLERWGQIPGAGAGRAGWCGPTRAGVRRIFSGLGDIFGVWMLFGLGLLELK
jgi:hypothetical protein